MLHSKEFVSKLGIDKLFRQSFKTNDPVFKEVLNKDTLITTNHFKIS